MKVSLPVALEKFVSAQVQSGEFDDASDVLSEAVRLMRETREKLAIEEMRATFAPIDPITGNSEPREKERGLINQLVKKHRAAKRHR